MVNLHSLVINFGLDYLAIRIALTLLVVAAVVLMPKSAPLERWFWAAVAGGLLVSPHTFAYDVALLLIPILKIACDRNSSNWARAIVMVAVMPFPYFMTMLPAPFAAGPALLIAVLFLLLTWPEWFNNDRVTDINDGIARPAHGQPGVTPDGLSAPGWAKIKETSPGVRSSDMIES